MNNTTANMPLKDSLKPSPLALLPIGVFLVIYAGSGIIFHDFYNMPAINAFLAALLTAFLQTRTLSFSEKITVIAKGLADENIITMCLIFLTEYVSGTILKKRNCCPWDYSHAKLNIHGVIRLDYAPVWFLTGLLYERFLTRADRRKTL